jgi:hypothetical protein
VEEHGSQEDFDRVIADRFAALIGGKRLPNSPCVSQTDTH